MNVRLLGAAQVDIIEAADWYEQQLAGLGNRYFAAVDRTIERIGRLPRTGGRVPRTPRGREVRETLVGGFPFLLTYEVTSSELIVLSAVHARSIRRPWRRRLP
jgi:plasmid stabilization system protein ParE